MKANEPNTCTVDTRGEFSSPVARVHNECGHNYVE